MEIIFNPKAAHGRGIRNVRIAEEWLREKKLSYHLIETRYSGHASELASDAVKRGVGRLTVMGGDGTIAEVISGIIQSNLSLGIIAVGTGNDIARSLRLPINNPRAALDVIQRGRLREIDVGREGNRYFVSVLGVGFPVTVVEEANKMKRLGGFLAFFLAVYKGLSKMRAVPVFVQLDDASFEISCTSIMVLNTPYTGGGLCMAPEARMDDGLLDVVMVNDIGKLDLMLNFPIVYRGRHFKHPNFSVYRSSAVRIDSSQPLRKMFDGDIYGTVPVDATIIRKAVKVIS